MSLTPSFELRGTVQQNPGYTETGATTNATYAASTSSVVEAEIGLSAQAPLGGGILSGSVGWVNRSSVGSNSVDVTLSGSTTSVSASAEDYNSGRIGIGYDFAVGARGMVSLAGTALLGSSGVSGQNVSAEFGMKF